MVSEMLSLGTYQMLKVAGILGNSVLCHAAVNNRQICMLPAFFLGLFEAGLWPGILVLLFYWYRPDEIAPRIVLVTILGNLSTVSSGLLAFVFNSMVLLPVVCPGKNGIPSSLSVRKS